MCAQVHTVGLLGQEFPSARTASARLKSFHATSVGAYVGLDPRSVSPGVVKERLSWWQTVCGNDNVYHNASTMLCFDAFVKRVETWLSLSRGSNGTLGLVLDHLSAREIAHPTVRRLFLNARHHRVFIVSVQPYYLDWRPDVRTNVDEWVVATDMAPRNLERFCNDHDCPLPPRDLGWGVWQCHLPVATSWLPFQE